MSVRALANLHCANCSDVTLHRANVCVRCDTPNNASGNPPVPRSPHFNTHKAKNYSAALQAAGDKRRAREARAKALTRIRA
jgi:hypothetical protein